MKKVNILDVLKKIGKVFKKIGGFFTGIFGKCKNIFSWIIGALIIIIPVVFIVKLIKGKESNNERININVKQKME